ncbi:hypothetical protein F3C99_11305 [Vitellibacter sp. q18]|nr:hypothetical protein [Aequorivita lutea]
MTKVIYILFLFIGFSTLAQNSVADLDRKNGFKNFTFGQPYILYSHKLEEYDMPDLLADNRKWYLYTGAEPSELFYIPWDKLYLLFTGNILTKIKVNFQTKDINKVDQIFAGLKREFGSPTSESKTYIFTTYNWTGKNISLHFSYENDNEKNIEIEIYDSALHYITLQKNKGKF